MWFKKKLSQRGDTIVEVLIVLSVLGLAFGISSATANRSLQQSRNAEEHSQAMGVLSSQIEMVRKALASGVTLPNTIGQKFCMTSDSAYATTDSPTCNSGSIPFSSAVEVKNGYYELVVSWDGVGTMGPQQEVYNYKIYDVHGNAAGGSGGNTSGGGISISPNPPPPPPPLPGRPTINYFRYTASNFNSTIATGNTRTVNAGGSATWNLPPTHGSLNGAVSWSVSGGSDAASVNCTLTGAGNPTAVGASGSRAQNLGKPAQGRYSLSCVSVNSTGQSSSLSSTVSVDVVNGYKRFYRSLGYDGYAGVDHFYSTDMGEGPRAGHTQQGSIGYINTGPKNVNETELYRFWTMGNPAGDHLFKTDSGVPAGYIPEGMVGYVSTANVAGTSPIFLLGMQRPGSSPWWCDATNYDVDNFLTNNYSEYSYGQTVNLVFNFHRISSGNGGRYLVNGSGFNNWTTGRTFDSSGPNSGHTSAPLFHDPSRCGNVRGDIGSRGFSFVDSYFGGGGAVQPLGNAPDPYGAYSGHFVQYSNNWTAEQWMAPPYNNRGPDDARHFLRITYSYGRDLQDSRISRNIAYASRKGVVFYLYQ